MKVYDCFTFHDELDMLELRLRETYAAVDRFVIVSARETFQGNPTPVYFLDNQQRFAEFRDKIVHVVDEAVLPKDLNPPLNRLRETSQRNAIMQGLSGAEDGDVVLISDVDEIISASHISDCRPGGRYHELLKVSPLRWQMHLYYYYLDFKLNGGGWWAVPLAIPYRLLKSTTPHAARHANLRFDPQIPWGGWHFAYFGGVDAVIRKIESFSDSSYNQEIFKDRDILNSRMKLGLDLFGRDQRGSFVKELGNLPATVQLDSEKYWKMGWFHSPPTSFEGGCNA